MDRRNFLGAALRNGTIAGLLSLSPKARADALSDLQEALGQKASAEFLTIHPGSASFESLTRGYNSRWTAPNAKVVYLPLRESGIASALAAARDAGYKSNLRIRGGAHCYEDFVFNASTAAIMDMSLLNEVGFDAATGMYFAQAGANNYDLQSRLIRLGKTLPGGSCPTVGLGGHISGGGFGVLSRLYGLTVDWLSAVSLTHVRSGLPETVSVSHRSTGEELDLFWAHTGGGGGNFGIINRYEFEALPQAPSSATISMYGWDWSTIKANGGAAYLLAIIAFFQDLCRTLPPTSFLILKLAHQDAGQVQIIMQDVHFNGSGDGEASSAIVSRSLKKCGLTRTAETLLPLTGHPNIAAPVVRKEMTWWEAVTFFGAGGSGPFFFKNKSAFLNTGFTEADAGKIYKHLTRRMDYPMKDSLLQVDSYGGQINAVCRTDTAAWHRSSDLELQFQTYWSPEVGGMPAKEIEAINLAWIRDFYADMFSHLGGAPDPDTDKTGQWDGCYINYPDVDLKARGDREALQLYYGGNLPRLIKTKAAWDPANSFSHQLSIPTA